MVFSCGIVLKKSLPRCQAQTVKALSSGKAKFFGELVAEKQEFLDDWSALAETQLLSGIAPGGLAVNTNIHLE
jgi:hypothetical protein